MKLLSIGIHGFESYTPRRASDLIKTPIGPECYDHKKIGKGFNILSSAKKPVCMVNIQKASPRGDFIFNLD